MKKIQTILTICGVLLLLGTAGASDANEINLEQMTIQLALGLSFFAPTVTSKIFRRKKEKLKQFPRISPSQIS